MTKTHDPGTDRSTNHLGLPPPSPAIELTDDGRAVGRIADNALGLQGSDNSAAVLLMEASKTSPGRAAAARRAPAPARRLPGRPAAMPLLARVIFAAMGLVATVALLAATPMTVAVPIGVVLIGGLLATALVVRIARRRLPLPIATDAYRQPQIGTASRELTEPEGVAGRGGLAVLSVALLALGLIVPEDLAVALSAVGLAGLFVLRLTMARPGSRDRLADLRRSRAEHERQHQRPAARLS